MSVPDENLVEVIQQLFGRTASIDTLSSGDPALAELVGTSLAAILRRYQPDSIAVWASPLTAVLGHVVARELDAKLVLAYSDQGILSSSPDFGSRVALVDYRWEPRPGLLPLARLFQARSAVVAIGSVVEPPPAEDALAEIPTVYLTQPSASVTPPDSSDLSGGGDHEGR